MLLLLVLLLVRRRVAGAILATAVASSDRPAECCVFLVGVVLVVETAVILAMELETGVAESSAPARRTSLSECARIVHVLVTRTATGIVRCCTGEAAGAGVVAVVGPDGSGGAVATGGCLQRVRGQHRKPIS